MGANGQSGVHLAQPINISRDIPRGFGVEAGIDKRYITSHRNPWWRVGLNKPAPIVASYMARQAPKFALNPDADYGATKKIDAIPYFPPFTYELEKRGYPPLADAVTYIPQYVTGTHVASRSWAEANRNVKKPD